jgi:hypothetical protein
MEFDVPTTKLQFGIALNSFGNLPEGAFVDLYDTGENFLGTIPISASPLVNFPEGLFNYSGGAVKFAEVYISEDSNAFAIDNIRFGNLVNRTLATGEGVTPPWNGSRFTAVLNARATSLGHGTGFFYFVVSGNGRGTLRSTRFNTVMLFGNRAVITGTALVTGIGNVLFVAEVVDGPRPGTDRVSVAFYPPGGGGGGGGGTGPLPITAGNFRVQ